VLAALLWIRIRIQGFEGFEAEQFLYLFAQKLKFIYPWSYIKDVQAIGEAFSPQKRTTITPKNKIY
jgi:hypothetical protein